MTKRLRIFLTNDDGYDSPGIRHLYEALAREHEVVVAAPQQEQSGIGHAFTFNKPLSFSKLPDSGMPCAGYIIKGTPSDCVKFAISYLLPRKAGLRHLGHEHRRELRHLRILFRNRCRRPRRRVLAPAEFRLFAVCKRAAATSNHTAEGGGHRKPSHGVGRRSRTAGAFSIMSIFPAARRTPAKGSR